MMKKHKIFSCILAASMLICQLPPVFAQSGTITISNKDELMQFSKNCTLDTWSQGKTVNLTCDINMENEDFSSIPTFGGTFNGNGYTISGINLTKNGSNLGLFRYIQSSGKVTNLNVKGNFIPGGSKSYIGGIAGENAGIIERCNFDGIIKGENVAGGIAGKNVSSGQIISCTSGGSVIGENSTGGIAGENNGLILSCENNAEVNTVYEEKKKEITDLNADAGAVIESYKTEKEENEEESVLGHTDTGGIVGYTSGVLQGCTNKASVGYQHIGYNVGGIAGRQSGYLLGCKNYGFIQGRKDVGGIVGQMEPYIILNASESALKDIQQELNNLHSMVDKFIADTDSLGDDTEKHLSGISEYSKNAQDNAEILLNQGTDFVDDNLGEINAQIAIISNTIKKLEPVFDSLESGIDDMSQSLDDITSALDSIEIYAPDLSDEIDDISSVISDIAKAQGSMEKANLRARRVFDDLDDAIKFNNQTQVKSAVSELSAAIKDIIAAKKTIETSLETIEAILSGKPEDFKDIGINAKKIAESLKAINKSIGKSIDDLQAIEKSLDSLKLNGEIDFSSLKSAAGNMESAIIHLSDSMFYIMNAFKELGIIIEDSYDVLEEYTDDVNAQLNSAKEDLSGAVTSLSYAADDIKDSVDNIKQIISDLSKEKTPEFVKLGDNFKEASENLFNSLSDISGEIDKLKNTASDGKNKITSNLTAISNQFNLVMNLMTGEIDKLQDSSSLSDKFLDVSDEDIENTKQGKAAECQNFGKVEADRNTGGIAGAMAIEYSKDPEDDIEKPDTLNFTYRTKAILISCINDGEVTGKKDCTGGIVGFAEIGTVLNSENYGNTLSTGGNYIGGIAGKSESIVRKCYAKCKVEGKRYIGGIAGKADSLASCGAIVTVSGDECIGAICGACDSRENVYKNLFVDNGLGAIDGISYKDAAEPVSFGQLKNTGGIPKRFISFTVTFIADDKIIETQEVKYGDDTSRINYPQIPEKKGQFGTWQTIEAETVTENIEVECEYKPYITILSSSEKNENGKLSLALAEGEFTDKSELHITESKEAPPSKAHGDIKIYDAVLSDTDIQQDDTVTLRFINENRDNVTAWLLKNGEWEQTEIKERGKYVILNTTGAKSTICLQYTKKAFNFIYLILIALIIIGGICIIKFVKSKRRVRK